MARFKSYLLVVIGFAVAGAIGTAFGTGTAQAVVSTLVTIVNTAANPVLTQHVAADNPSSQAVWLSCSVSFIGSSCKLADNNGPYTVPVGNRLVIESFSGVFAITTGSNGWVQYQNPGYVFYVPAMHQYSDTANNKDYYPWGLAARFYVDSGQNIIGFFGTFMSGTGSAYFTAYGHLEKIQ